MLDMVARRDFTPPSVCTLVIFFFTCSGTMAISKPDILKEPCILDKQAWIFGTIGKRPNKG
jgi:hypothetical protein